MNQGKDICSHLKAIRRAIAQENDIDLEIPECTFKGNCSGTCPQCESEVRFLENELARRISLGKAATVAGIALALASPAAAQTVDTSKTNNIQTRDLNQPQLNEKDTMRIAGIMPEQKHAICTLKGILWDTKMGESVPFANLVVRDPEGKQIKGAQSDIEGKFTLKDVPDDDDLTIRITCVGYQDTIVPLREFREHNWFQKIIMPNNPKLTGEVIIVGGIGNRQIDIGGQTMQEFDKDGVHVRVEY